MDKLKTAYATPLYPGKIKLCLNSANLGIMRWKKIIRNRKSTKSEMEKLNNV